MRRGDDLAVVPFAVVRDRVVHLSLSQDLEVGVRLVEQQDRPGVERHPAEQHQRLLLPASRGRDVELGAVAIDVVQVDRAERGVESGVEHLYAEQVSHLVRHRAPTSMAGVA